MTKKKNPRRPTLEQLNRELSRRSYRKKYWRTMRGIIWTLIIVAATTIICSTFFFSVLLIQGTSMEPTFQDGQLVIVSKSKHFNTGEIVAFYYNNSILIKRVIGSAGEWVNIDQDGTVSINGQELNEPYIEDKGLGNCDITLPYQVPDGRWFVLGDRRTTSVDSRSTIIGTVAEEQVVGKVLFRIWPLSEFEPIS